MARLEEAQLSPTPEPCTCRVPRAHARTWQQHAAEPAAHTRGALRGGCAAGSTGARFHTGRWGARPGQGPGATRDLPANARAGPASRCPCSRPGRRPRRCFQTPGPGTSQHGICSAPRPPAPAAGGGGGEPSTGGRRPPPSASPASLEHTSHELIASQPRGRAAREKALGQRHRLAVHSAHLCGAGGCARGQCGVRLTRRD